MDVRRRQVSGVRSGSAGEALKPQKLTTATVKSTHDSQKHLKSSAADSQGLPMLPLCLTNGIFFGLFFSVAYFLLHRWREKIRTSTPLHVVTLSEIAAIVSLIASVIYLLGFFGIGFVQPISPRASSDDELELEDDDTIIAKDDSRNPGPCPAGIIDCSAASPPPSQIQTQKTVVPTLPPKIIDSIAVSLSEEDEEIIKSVVSGSIASYSLESKLGDCRRAAAIRKEAVQRVTGRSLQGLPLGGFDYESILGQCCEMPIGYVQIPVGVAGPLLLDGKEYTVPMATTEGCLVASTNRGCKAIYVSGGATSVLLKDGMTRAPVVRLPTAKRAAQLKFYLEDPLNFESLAVVFNK